MSFEPPIRNLSSLDILGVRKDGGVDAVIVAETPIDGSPETLAALSTKVRNYIAELRSPAFRAEHPRLDKVGATILINCHAAVDLTARGLIASLAQEALGHGIKLEAVDVVA